MIETPAQPLPAAPRPPGVVRRFMSEHPVVVDSIITAGYLIGCALMLFIELSAPFLSDRLFTQMREPFTGIGFYVPRPEAMYYLAVLPMKTAAVALSLFFRRHLPLLGAGVAAVAFIFMLDQSLQPIADGVAMLFLLYAIPVFKSTAQGWIGFAITSAATMIYDLRIFREISLTGSTQLIVLMLIVLLVAINLGNRRRYVQALVERAEMLERDREQLARIAVGRERDRISREMHDIVAHSVSVMIALSEGASRAVVASPDQAADAMRRSAETGRTALGQMRRLINGLTRSDEADHSAEFAPQPGIANIDELIAQFRDTGIEIHTQISGIAPDDEGFSLTVYRIVQESLTNVLRYAGVGARAEVAINYGAETTEIRVRDHGRAPGHIVQEHVGSGSGLRGLTERVRMFGGVMHAGPAPNKGWLVEVSLPNPMKGTMT